MQHHSCRYVYLGVLVLSVFILAASQCSFGTFGTRCQFQCHCKQPLDCDGETGICVSGCSSPWSGRNCQQENVSFNTSTSHKNGTASTPASFGVDGNITTCAVTSNGVNGWWMTKLERSRIISKMYLISEKTVPLMDWQIMIGDDSNLFTMQRCAELDTPESATSVFCERPIKGQYIAVLNRLGPVVVCELSVYVCTKYAFGSECERECACKDTTEQCDVATGTCMSGCRSGRLGLDCQTDCIGSYGPGCSHRCGHCFNGTCDFMSGICPQKCEAGWQGITCQTRCQAGFYGFNCNNRCGHCKGGAICHHVNGSCPSGCQTGWTGSICLEGCNNTYFGNNCSSRCGGCFGEICDRVTGRCTSGCKPGLVGDRCDQDCPKGLWGLRCDEHCGHCNNSRCNPTNGYCTDKCQPGWAGDRCFDVCPGGFYGNDCTEECGKCKSGKPCNSTTGICKGGCESGYQGSHCKPIVSSEPQFSEEASSALPVFLGISVTIAISVMVCLIVCLVSNWRREDISKYDRNPEQYNRDLNLEELRHLNCNGDIPS